MKKEAPALVLFGFLYMWLMVGFVTGTMTLLGPVRWLTTRFRAAGWPGESAAVITVIVLYVAASLLVTRWLYKRAARSPRRGTRVAIPAALTVAALTTGWAWMTPGAVIGAEGEPVQEVSLRNGANFVFGPYPDSERLEELREAGFTGIVSLLHPAVVPFEPKLLGDEREAVGKAGLRFIHAPMLPWVGDNEASLERVRQLAREGVGRYYVHCYLGRDRANAVKRVVEAEGIATDDGGGLEGARSLDERKEPFERGAPQQLEADVWVIPFPNDHELFGYVLFGSTGHVLSLLDTTDVRQAAWQRHAAELMDEYAIPHTSAPLRAGDEEGAREIAARAMDLPRPLIIVVPNTPPKGDGGVAETFRRSFERTSRPARGAQPRPRFTERRAAIRTGSSGAGPASAQVGRSTE